MPVVRALLPSASGPLDDTGLDEAYAAPGGRWVRCGFAHTVDGAIELGGRSGGIGGPADRRVFAALRARADVVVAGSATASTEGYGVVRLDAGARARRAARGQRADVPVAVVSNRGRLDPGMRLFVEGSEAGQPRPIVITSGAASPADRAALGEVADVVVCGDDAIDDAAAVAALADRGLNQVLCEGGPTLAGRWLAAGLVDELCLTTGAVLAGPGHAGLVSGTGWPDPVPVDLDGLLVADSGALFARYRTRAREDQR